jgi:hypothetical protein
VVVTLLSDRIATLELVERLARDVVAENFMAGRGRLARALDVVWNPTATRRRCRIGKAFQRKSRSALNRGTT